MTCSIDLSLTNALLAVGLYFVVSYGISYFKNAQNKTKLKRWEDTPKDKVIVHGVPRGYTMPNISPFVLKLETYLRMAKIPYDLDTTDPWSPLGQTPWISYNGHHVPDSQLSIEFLQKKLNKVQEKYSLTELSAARAHRLVLETNFKWGLAQWRWDDGMDSFGDLMEITRLQRLVYGTIIGRDMKKAAWYHGIGRHSKKEIYRMASDDVRSLSQFLGTKKFILGDEPCVDDCGIFGMVSQLVWGAPGSPFEKLVNEELPNIKPYCYRMKETFWKDWDQCLLNK